MTGLNLAGALVTVTAIVSRELELLGCAGVSSGAERETEVALVSIFFFASQRERERVLCLHQCRNCKFAYSTKMHCMRFRDLIFTKREGSFVKKKQRFHTQHKPEAPTDSPRPTFFPPKL